MSVDGDGEEIEDAEDADKQETTPQVSMSDEFEKVEQF